MKRTIVISDIHGCVEQLDALLQLSEYNSDEDRLILLGDYVDRGPASKEAVDRVIALTKRHHAIALRGNHDQRLVDLIEHDSTEVSRKFAEHGGVETIRSYCPEATGTIMEQIEQTKSVIEAQYRHHISFLSELPLYVEDESHIYVHAGINPAYTNWREQPDHDFMYIKQAFYEHPSKADKPVVFGHTRTEELHGKPNIWFAGDKIGIDGGCAYGMQLNALIYENGQYAELYVKKR